MINAELAVRTLNERSVEKLKHHIPKTEQNEVEIAFNCECSDLSCEERILLTLEDYENLHDEFSHFIIAQGHNEPKVEKVVEKTKNFSVVEKYSLT